MGTGSGRTSEFDTEKVLPLSGGSRRRLHLHLFLSDCLHLGLLLPLRYCGQLRISFSASSGLPSSQPGRERTRGRAVLCSLQPTTQQQMEQFTPLLALLFALPLLFLLRRRLSTSTRPPLPPGPPPGWFGNTIPQPFSWRFFEDWTKEYGDVFTVWIGRTPMVVVGSYRASMELLEAQSALTADRPWVSARGAGERNGLMEENAEYYGRGHHVGREEDLARQVRRTLASFEEVRRSLSLAMQSLIQ